MKTITNNLTTTYTLRTEVLEGREHLVVPVVMMVEGVHYGSGGPLLHLREDLAKAPHTWNGVPVTIDHPQEEGLNVSANSPGILERYAVGKIFNSRMDGDKLKAEAWLDVQRMAALSPLALSYIQEGKPLEVSIGAFIDAEPLQGVYNGASGDEQYEAIARNIRPDHLALLPGEQGACSWRDGCGIRANKLFTLKCNANETMTDEQIQTMKSLIREGFQVGFVTDAGYLELVNKAQQKLDSMDNEQTIHYLEEVYDDYLIYRTMSRETRNTPKLYRQGFSVAADGSLEFSGDPVRVRKEVDYLQVSSRRTKFNNNNSKKEAEMAEKEKPCCEERVNALIANKATPWSEKDKEWLLTQDAYTLGKLEPKEEEPKKDPAPTFNREDFIAKESLKTTEDFIKILPTEELKDQFKTGLRLNADYRKNLIDSIITNSQEGVWGEDELKEYPTAMLEKLNKQFPAPVDFSGKGIKGTKVTNNSEPAAEPLAPMGVELED